MANRFCFLFCLGYFFVCKSLLCKVIHSDDQWSLRKLTKPETPKVKNVDWPSNEIDFFILNKLEKKGIDAPLRAEKSPLNRRLSYTLVGLPPNKVVLESTFLEAIDLLLASPHYGEKWGRHWMDIVRYADSNGLDENLAFAHAWRYRDYIIDAFNQDHPYDQFVREQIAGDLLSTGKPFAESTRLKIATGFLALGPKLLAEPDPVKMEMDMIDEQIDVIGQAFLGLTIACARCHDHMSDPISTDEYYKLAGILKSTRTMEKVTRPTRWFEHIISNPLDKNHYEKFQALVSAQKALINAFKEQINAELLANGKIKKLPKNPVNIYSDADKKELAIMENKLSEYEEMMPQLDYCHGVEDGNVTDLNTFLRGDPDTLGEKQRRGFISIFPAEKRDLPGDSQSGRLELARWITKNSESLLARVMVNRIWLWHFGKGLVSTPDNFGSLGAKPTHPKLLDWLACFFIENGWSVKKLNKFILSSSTWQSSSRISQESMKRDPVNILYSRYPIRAMEVEDIRDTWLSMAGDLNLTIGGKAFEFENRKHIFTVSSVDQTTYESSRRSIYLPVIRNHVYDFFKLFDFPDPKIVQGNRKHLPTSQQALYLMNSPFVQSVSKKIVQKMVNSDIESSIGNLFLKIYLREPEQNELSESINYVDHFPNASDDLHPYISLVQAMLCSNEFLYIR